MAEKIPKGARVTYARQFRRCGKAACRRCAGGSPGHGPYWYAFWDQDGRRRSCYLGKEPPPAARPVEEEPPPASHAAPRRDLRVHTLGAFQVWRDDTALPAPAWRSRPAATLFKALLTAEGYRLHREQVLELLWPDMPPTQGRRNFHAAIHQLRRVLDPPQATQSYVSVTREMVLLRPSLEDAPAYDWLDASAFSHGARAALTGQDTGACAAAIALYGGMYLPGALYEDWAIGRRAELRDLYLVLLLHQADLHTRRGENASAAHTLRLVLANDGCNEQAAAKLMAILAADGARAEAIQIYQALEERLREDLGLVPNPELHARYTTILAHPTNLPAPLTSFIGRRGELARLMALLEGARILSLVGVGGVGKTRLALQVAASVLYQYQDGVWLVDLAPVLDPQALPQAVMGALGLTERPARTPLSTVLEHLRDKHLLLVLDNCEHLLAAAADTIAEILAASPEVRVLATSREALGVAGEIAWPVPPLSLTEGSGNGSLAGGSSRSGAAEDTDRQSGERGGASGEADRVCPDSNDRLPSDAMRLFMARLRASRPGSTIHDFDRGTIGRICRRLEGLPLAIELAAARAGSIPLAHIEARLDDRFALLTRGPRTARPRQQTLRATMDWSFGLLDESEQHLLCRLSVFAGGCTVEAVTAVAGLEGNAPTVGRTLERLAAKSLTRRITSEDEPRYGLLETIRHYGELRLAETGEQDRIRRRHCLWYLEQQEVADAAWYSPAQPAALAWTDREQENLRAALARSVEKGDQHAGVRFLAVLWRFWETRGYLMEGRRWQDRILLDPMPQEASVVWARALAGAGRLAELAGDYSRAATWYENSLAFWRQLDERQGIADSLLGLGVVRASEGNLNLAEQLFHESLDLNRALAYRPGIIVALNNLGGVAFYRSDTARAAVLWQESLDLSRRQGDLRSAARALNNLGEVARNTGQRQTAAARFREGLTINRGMGDMAGIALSLEGISATLSALGIPERAARLRGAVDAARESAGLSITPQDRATYDRDGAHLLTALGVARFDAHLADGRTMGLEAAIDLALKD
ncbi:MAG TPA: BTAD domain-containing putative transcriptional regulator [Chloroflexota bacterium]|nr:BTAD domain-containing putative transcriptional regulator [Chloroflexota bacterium]